MGRVSSVERFYVISKTQETRGFVSESATRIEVSMKLR